MNARFRLRAVPGAARQRGQAAIIAVLLVVGVGAAVFVYSVGTPAKIAIERDRITAAALAKARDALIGYAATNTTRPGVLPCPDTDNNGTADSPCGVLGVTAIGRLPWKTLGLPDLRDGSGECLWYAVSANFKNSGTSAPAVVNADSAGTLVVNDTSGTPLYTGSNAALAVVFAPGGTLASQDRTSVSTTVCGGNMTVANYLEGGNQDGATTNIFVTGLATTSFNDQLLAITSDALFSVVTTRVAREIRRVLVAYYNANGYFPNANRFSDSTSGFGAYPCRDGVRQGRIPLTVRNPPQCLAQADWGGAYTLPTWFSTNEWNRVLFYAVAGPCAGSTLDTLLCNTLGNPLNLLGSPVRALLIGTGRGFADQPNRPCGTTNCVVDDLLDDRPQNTDGDDVFVKPALSPSNNDRLVVVSP